MGKLKDSRGARAGALALVLLLAAGLSRCGGTSKTKVVDGDDAGFPPRDVDASFPLPDAGAPDAGVLPPDDAGLPDPVTPDAGSPDAGTPDAGAPDAGEPDAGAPDAGQPDAGTAGPPTPTLQQPQRAQVQWVGHDNLLQASADDGGFVWAVSRTNIFLLRPGATSFETYGNPHGPNDQYAANAGIISVAGAGPGEAWVGYEGEFTHGEADDPSVPLYIRQSGGADHFYATRTGIQLDKHVMFWTPPGVLKAEPTGRWKVRSIYTIVVNRGPKGVPGDVFFGGTHGVGMVQGGTGYMEEHQHAGYNYCTSPDPGSCTLVAGDHFGVAIHPFSGNLWMGADFAETFLAYNENNPNHDIWTPTVTDPGAPFDKSFRAWVGRSVDNQRPEFGGRDFVRAMTFDAYGDLWIGSYYNGIARARIRATDDFSDPRHPVYAGQALARDGKSRAMSQDDLDYWNHRFGNKPAWPTDFISPGGLAGDPDGSLWIGTPNGAWRLVAATGQAVGYAGVLPSNDVRGISVDPRPGVHAVYLATGSGLAIYRGP